MKCPKCGYISFDDGDRCRHCGFDMALGAPAAGSDRNLRPADPPAPLLDLPGKRVSDTASAPPVDVLDMRESTVPADSELPLFDRPMAGVDDTPLVVAPASARIPLAVRRSTVDPARDRPADLSSDWERQVEHHVDRLMTRQPEPPAPPPRIDRHQPRPEPAIVSLDELLDRPAPAVARLGAALVDGVILLAVDFAVVYFTLQLTHLDFARIGSLPALPLAAFFGLLNGGYFVGFTMASGQTIGKMVTRIRVVSESARKVPLGAAILRAAGILVTVLSLGVGYLPALLGRERRALHDRLAGTRVVPRR